MNYRNSTFLTQFRASGHREVPKDPITAAVVSALGVTGTAATVVTILTQLAITAVVSWAVAALTPKPSAPTRKLMANIREAAASQEYVYGQVRKGGVVTYLETSGGSSEHRDLFQVIVLAGHPVEEIGNIYINDEIVTLDGEGFVQEDKWKRGDTPLVKILKFDGTQTTNPPEVNVVDNFIGVGISYLLVKLSASKGDTWRNGIPLITAEVKGKKVFDPRTGITAYTDNAALCIRDYLVDPRGMDDAGNVDDVTFSAAANTCITRNYKMNGVIDSELPTGSILQNMVTTCAGTLFWGGGKWRLKAGEYTSPVKTFTADDLRSPISLQTKNQMRDNFNVVQGLFNDKEQRWIEGNYPEHFENAFIQQDNGVRSPLQFNLPLVTDVNQATFLAALTLRRTREQITLSADFGVSALEVEPGDVIRFSFPRYGWVDKEFEVQDWRLAPSTEGGDIRVSLTLREISETAFDPTAPVGSIPFNNSSLNIGFDTVDPISNLQVQDRNFIAPDGTFVNNALVTWVILQDDFVFESIVEWKKTTEEEYTSAISPTNTFTITNLEPEVAYDIRVTPRNTLGTLGQSLETVFTTSADTTIPGAAVNIVANGEFRAISLSWTNPTDFDFEYMEIWESEDENLFNAIQIATSYGDTFIRSNLGISVTRYYWLRAVDSSGNKSDFVGPASATTTFIDDNAFENGIRQLFRDAGLSAPEIVDVLPETDNFTGRLVFLTTDGKLYRYTSGGVWTAAVPAVDVTGQITATQITDGAISTPKLAAGAVTADNIAGNTITGDKIVANTITGGLLATSGIITDTAQIGNAVITNAKIENLAVDTIKIAGNAVTSSRSVEGPNAVTTSSDWQTAISITFSALPGAPLSIFTYALLFAQAPVAEDDTFAIAEFRLRVNGSNIWFGSAFGSYTWIPNPDGPGGTRLGTGRGDAEFPSVHLHSVPTTTVTIDLQYRISDGTSGAEAYVVSPRIVPLELKR